MPVDIQMVLELYYWEELSVDEVAEVVGAPAGTIKGRLFRGRALLREAMEKMPEESAQRMAREMLASRADGSEDGLDGDGAG
jgi:RNA polymerase sigma-70 factor (ECF subfamily)